MNAYRRWRSKAARIGRVNRAADVGRIAARSTRHGRLALVWGAWRIKAASFSNAIRYVFRRYTPAMMATSVFCGFT